MVRQVLIFVATVCHVGNPSSVDSVSILWGELTMGGDQCQNRGCDLEGVVSRIGGITQVGRIHI